MSIFLIFVSVIQKVVSLAYIVFFVDKKLSGFSFEDTVTISTLLCHRDAILFICSLKTFFLKSEFTSKVCVTDDGTLLLRDKFLLRFFFPSITIINRNDSDAKIMKYFGSFPEFINYRRKVAKHFYKLDAIINASTEKVILFDADILFYKKPKEICSWISSKKKYCMHTEHDCSFFSSEYYPEITIRSLFNKILNASVSTTFSSGLILLNKSHFLSYFNEDYFLTFKRFRYVTSTAEEYLLGLLCYKAKSKLLPVNKYVAASYVKQYSYYFINKNMREDLVMFHYGWEVKKFFFKNFILQMRVK